ncbi:MAG TPA: hypothetical protein VLG47_07240 [Candidatus Saccharimonadales bacterium]|nr:hypothetical protein [Candidatus Saccharimonadales bacterium]
MALIETTNFTELSQEAGCAVKYAADHAGVFLCGFVEGSERCWARVSHGGQLVQERIGGDPIALCANALACSITLHNLRSRGQTGEE